MVIGLVGETIARVAAMLTPISTASATPINVWNGIGNKEGGEQTYSDAARDPIAIHAPQYRVCDICGQTTQLPCAHRTHRPPLHLKARALA